MKPVLPAGSEPLVRLALAPGVGPARLGLLLARFGNAEAALGAAAADIAALPGIGPVLAGRVVDAGGAAGQRRLRETVHTLERVGARVLTRGSAEYPPAFEQLADPPHLLFASGETAALEGPGIAIVGTRSPTAYGRRTARALATALAHAGMTVVSGMARGIDAEAHGAALESGAPSVGVLGHGVDEAYPRENRRLFETMRARGILLTEYPPGELPRAGNFPRRNRLIAALSQGVLVVQMALRSGAQHTVTAALELGREVFAVPGPIDVHVCEGTNQLLREGAKLVSSLEDVLEELPARRWLTPPARPRSDPARGAGVAAPDAARGGAPLAALAGLSPAERAILEALESEPRHVDAVAGTAGVPAREALVALLGLEMRGAVEALPGQHYRRQGGGLPA